MQRIYLDSNVFISLFDREIGKGLRGLFVEAELFLEKVREQRWTLVLSDLFFIEVKKHCFLSVEEILAYLKKLGIQVEIIEANPKTWKELRKLGMHFSDSLHAVTAIENRCDCIVTFNVKHFERIKSKIKVFDPREFY